MRNLVFGLAVAVGAWLTVPAANAVGLPYQFIVNSAVSGFDGSAAITVGTSGTLVGNYDEVNDPTGTRTKPGLFGPFGDTENVPVPVNLGAGLGGDIYSATAGSFGLDLDAAAGTLVMTALQMNLLASGPQGLTLTVTVDPDTFRTRNPTSIYPGVEITVPLGQIAVSDLTLQQNDLPAPGVLNEVEPGHYQFTVAPVVTLTGTVDVFGNMIDLPGTPLPLLLTGDLLVSGQTAVLTSVQSLEWSDSTDPQLQLPQFPLDLPTILPPGETAHLLFDLLVNQVGVGLNGTLTTEADGTLVPEPTSLLGLLLGAASLARRGRR
jgi:hypothetical protein